MNPTKQVATANRTLTRVLGAAFCGLLLGVPLRPATAADRQLLPGHVPAVVASLQPVGRLPGNQRLRLAIGLPLRNQQELQVLLQQLYDPGSPNYHRYLTPTEFADRFGPTVTDYEELMHFARTNGLEVTLTHPNRVVLDVAGTVSAIEQAFHLTLRVYRHPQETRDFYAPDVDPSVDFAPPLLHISGLDDYFLPHPNLKPRPTNLPGDATPNSGSGPNGSYRGSDFRQAYVPGTPLTGAGQSVGLLQFDGFYPSDIATYASQAGLPTIPVTVVPVDGGVATPGGGNSEVCLDIEMVMSMAPGVTNIYVYEAPNPSPWVDLLNAMANHTPLSMQLSCSWGGGSPDATAEGIFQQMAAQGQSFFNASGDSDAFTGAIPFPSDSPHITEVGGTTLTTGTGASYSSETVWNWGSQKGKYVGSSGGISTYYTIPVWQQGFSMTAAQGSTTMRNVPDVALTADNVYVVYNNGSSAAFGGTSCAAPLWAGFMALVNQQAAANGKPAAGFINPAVYALGQSSSYATSFHDTTTGNNFTRTSPTRFAAVTGYDLCTGWGTPTLNLINALALPGTVTFTGTPTNGTAPLTVSFTSVGSGVSSYSWSFGNGQTSTLANPVITYTNAGTYTVSLTATGPGGSSTLTRTNYIVVTNSPPVVSFVGSPTSGVAPLTVSFVNSSTGATNYSWAFGDGQTSTLPSPSVTYTNPGTYSVALTAVGPGGTRTLTRANYITATAPVVADFSGAPTSGVAPLTVTFVNLSSGASSYSWAFGNGHISTAANPSVTYSGAGNYSVTLTAVGAGGTKTLTRINYITVVQPVMADFTGAPTSGIAPLTVTFTNLSSGATNYAWTFGDGNAGADVHPVNTYTNPGTYSVSLIATGPGGVSALTRTNYITVVQPVMADFTGAPTSGIAPLTVTFTNLSSGATNYAWTFGDGNAGADVHPVNTYTNPGTYSVSLIATGPGGMSALTRTNYIVVSVAPPVSDLLLSGALLLPDGGFRFVIGNADGTPVTSDQQSRIDIYMSSDITSALPGWTQLTNPTVLTNNLLEVTDPDGGLGQRFYRAVQQP